MMRVVFVGPPGAGKGTQAARLAADAGVPHIATGDMFRVAVREGTPLGRKAKEFMDRGQLVPDDVTIGIVRERLMQPDCRRGFVLDGFPRTLPQAEALDRMLDELGLPLDHVLYLSVSDEELVRRAASRRVCPQCGAVYNREGVCDRCGVQLVQRDDDREETVRRRLAVYRSQTEPLVQYYQGRAKLREIDGSRSIEAVRADIRRALNLDG